MISAHTKVAHVMYVKGRLVGVQALDLMNEEAGEKQIREDNNNWETVGHYVFNTNEAIDHSQIMRQEFI